ncbi:MAG: DUF1273 family protein [Clostridia bacterium]|nr:DUF1273 family protein [Clostridia bacterium]
MNENHISCCFTGYRPQKFPFSLENKTKEYTRFENALFEQILSLAEQGCHTFYCGMAMGFDLVAAENVIAVKNAFREPLKVICVLPFKGQSATFSDYWKRKFDYVLENCDEQIYLAENYFRGCYQQRNIYMVDNSDYVVTWYDGQKGGTENTVRYALKKGRYVFNICETPDNLGFQTKIKV